MVVADADRVGVAEEIGQLGFPTPASRFEEGVLDGMRGTLLGASIAGLGSSLTRSPSGDGCEKPTYCGL